MTSIASSILLQGLTPTVKVKPTAQNLFGTDTTAAVTPPMATPVAAQSEADVKGTVASPQTQVDTQNIAQAEKIKSVGDAAKDEFMKYSTMSWQDKVRAMILKSLGLKEEDLQKMSPEDRAKIEAKIKEKIEAEIKKKTGIDAAAAGTATDAVQES